MLYKPNRRKNISKIENLFEILVLTKNKKKGSRGNESLRLGNERKRLRNRCDLTEKAEKFEALNCNGDKERNEKMMQLNAIRV